MRPGLKVGDHVLHTVGKGRGILVTPHGSVFVGGRSWSTIVFWGGEIVLAEEPPSDELWAAYVNHCLVHGEPR